MEGTIREIFRQEHQEEITDFALLRIRMEALPSASLLALPLESSFNQMSSSLYSSDEKLSKAEIDELIEEEIIHITQ